MRVRPRSSPQSPPKAAPKHRNLGKIHPRPTLPEREAQLRMTAPGFRCMILRPVVLQNIGSSGDSLRNDRQPIICVFCLPSINSTPTIPHLYVSSPSLVYYHYLRHACYTPPEVSTCQSFACTTLRFPCVVCLRLCPAPLSAF